METHSCLISRPQPIALGWVLFAVGVMSPACAQTVKNASPVTMQIERATTVQVAYEHKFLLYLPDGYDQNTKDSWPLMLFLHGAGERGDGDLDLVTVHGPPKLIKQGKKFPCIVVSPQCPQGRWWDAAELSSLLNDIEENYRVDKKRIYVTGLSMGGYGVWSLALREPNRFAAIAPICGGGNIYSIPYLDKLTAPIWAFHGAQDAVIPISELYEMQQAQERRGVEMKVTVYPEVNHDSWNNAYEDNDELFHWLFGQQRD